MVSFPYSIKTVITTQWVVYSVKQRLPQALNSIVFTVLDLMDCIFCLVFAILDELLEGESAPQCCCLASASNSNSNLNSNSKWVSETLYGEGRRNLFRKMGRLNRWLLKWDVLKMTKWRRESLNRWSDCGCQSCLSWIQANKSYDDLRLHLVVQEPQIRSPATYEDPSAKSTENVVFLHGFMSSSSFWTETVFNNLNVETKNKYKLIAIDLLGFGKSPKPRDCLYTLKDHLEIIEKSVIFPYGLKSFHIVAHSMGSTIALALAAKYPESVKSLALVAPPYFTSSKDALKTLTGKRLWPPLVFGASFMSWYEHLGRIICFIVCRNHRICESILRFLTWKRDLNFMIMDFTRHTHHSAWHSMHNVICGGAKLMDEYLEILSQRRVKITVIQGDEDQVVPLECCSNIKMKVPEADIRVIPKVDHITVVLNQSKEFTQILEGIWLSCN